MIPAANGVKTYPVEMILTGLPFEHMLTRMQIDFPHSIGDETPKYVLEDLRLRNIIDKKQFSIYINHELMMFNHPNSRLPNSQV